MRNHLFVGPFLQRKDEVRSCLNELKNLVAPNEAERNKMTILHTLQKAIIDMRRLKGIARHCAALCLIYAALCLKNAFKCCVNLISEWNDPRFLISLSPFHEV